MFFFRGEGGRRLFSTKVSNLLIGRCSCNVPGKINHLRKGNGNHMMLDTDIMYVRRRKNGVSRKGVGYRTNNSCPSSPTEFPCTCTYVLYHIHGSITRAYIAVRGRT